jgi:hypothetical protein
MHDDAEATGNFSDQARQIGSPAAGGRLLDEAHDLRRDLARSMGAAFDWQQANQTANMFEFEFPTGTAARATKPYKATNVSPMNVVEMTTVAVE